MEDTKPFIKLFKTPLGYYCYDGNTLSMLRITQGMYQILKGNEIEYDEDSHYKIEKLKENGYLSVHRSKEIKHPYTEVLKEYLNNNIRRITLQVTQNCNLACRYCAYVNPKQGKQRRHANKRMSFDMVIKGVDFLFEKSSNIKDINIGFYEGNTLIMSIG